MYLSESRKEMLERWRKEKDLKRKIDAQSKRKPGFKVSHLEVPVDPLTGLSKLPPVKQTVAAKVSSMTHDLNN